MARFRCLLRRAAILGVVAATFCLLQDLCHAAGRGEFELRAVDDETGEPIAVRMHLRDQKGRSRRPKHIVRLGDHFVFFHKVVLELPAGSYTFTLEHGPEYHVRSGHFAIEPGATDNREVRMTRYVDMKEEGWWSGDLHIARPTAEIELLMAAEDLHVASVLGVDGHPETELQSAASWLETADTNFDGERFFSLRGARDYRDSGSLLLLQLDSPLLVGNGRSEFPPAAANLKPARSHSASHLAIEFPESWDTPMWLASQMIDSVGLATSRIGRQRSLGPRGWGKPRNETLFPGPRGAARWSEHVYYQMLNCGLRIPPSAASGSGTVANPVGYNRVYAYVDGAFSAGPWWESLRAGRVVITNGPLLRPSVRGYPPGHVFTAGAGETLRLSVDLKLAMRDPGDYLEVIRDGRVEHVVRLDDYAAAGGHLPELEFDESGWFLVRVVSDTPSGQTYRFGCTAPYYVEIGGQPRISRSAANFFLDWVYERARLVHHDDPAERREILRYHRAARDYWQRLVDRATVP